MRPEDSIEWKGYYEKEAEYKRFTPSEDGFEVHRVNLVKSLLPKERLRNALDVGCGDGYLCSLYKKMGVERVVGTDLSKNRIDYAKANYGDCEFLQADINNLKFPDGSFELVSAVEVIEHLENPTEAVKEMSRLSSRYVLITVPYKERLTEIVCPHCLKKSPLDGHIHSFDEGRLVSLCAQAGLKVVKTVKYNSKFVTGSLKFVPKPLVSALKNNVFKGIMEGSTFFGVLCIKCRD